MEFIKEKLPVILGVIIFVALCGFAIYTMENKQDYYYTQIDNTKIEKMNSSDSYDMKYKYTLVSYDKDGKEKKIKFKTSRELREGAFLKLKVLMSGVNNWEEVQYNELPEKVQSKYENPTKE